MPTSSPHQLLYIQHRSRGHVPAAERAFNVLGTGQDGPTRLMAAGLQPDKRRSVDLVLLVHTSVDKSLTAIATLV